MKLSPEQKSRLPEFTKRFRELQEDRSNKEFSDFLGMSRQTVGFYCNGDRIPDALGVKTIAEKCGVSADWLLGLTNDKEKHPTATDDLGLSHDAIMEIKNFGQGKLKKALDLFITDPDFCVFLYSLSEIIESSRLHRKDELISQYGPSYDDWALSSEMKYNAQEYARKKLSASDAIVVYGDLLIDLLKFKLNDSLNEIICGLISEGRAEAEAEYNSDTK